MKPRRAARSLGPDKIETKNTCAIAPTAMAGVL
jgi:hypothetical protein